MAIMKEFQPGTYLYEVHDNNDIVTNKTILRYREFVSSESELDETIHRLLTKTEGITPWGWIRVYREEQTRNEWPSK